MGSCCTKKPKTKRTKSQKSRRNKDLPVHGPPWKLLHDFSGDKWKKFSDKHKIWLQNCPNRVDDMMTNTWTSSSCTEGHQDKNNGMLHYCRHGNQMIDKSYNYNPLLQALLDDGDLVQVIPGPADFCCMHFAVDSLDDIKYHMVYAFKGPDVKGLYFFLEKWSYDMILQECAVSHDESYVVILISRGPLGTEPQFEMQVYSKRPVAYEHTFQGSMYEMEYEVPGIMSYSGVPRLLFDPRFCYSRLGMVNARVVAWQEVNSYLSVYDLTRKRPFLRHKQDVVMETRLLMDATYVPDGELIIALVLSVDVNSSSFSKCSRNLVIFNTASLLEIKVISTGCESLTECHINFLPVFSPSGRQMAVRHNRGVKLYQLPMPRSLEGLCRAVILSDPTLGDIDKLVVPYHIKKILKFQPTKY